MNSCQKGKRGERAWRDELIAHGYAARRGQQFSGSPDSPDVVCSDLPALHFEVKLVERLNVNEAMSQAVGDAGDKIPVLAHKRNRGDWLVTMRADDWFRLLAQAQPGQPRAATTDGSGN
jgi:Holliday junction resolvase